MRSSFITLLVPLSLPLAPLSFLFSLSSSKQWSKKITLGGWRLSSPTFINTNYLWSVTCYKESVGYVHCYRLSANFVFISCSPVSICKNAIFQWLSIWDYMRSLVVDGKNLFHSQKPAFIKGFQYVVYGCLFQDKAQSCSTTGRMWGGAGLGAGSQLDLLWNTKAISLYLSCSQHDLGKPEKSHPSTGSHKYRM